MKQTLQFLFFILLVVAGIVAWDGFYILEEGQQAVITYFGAPVGDPVTKAGLKFKLPFVHTVTRFEKKILIWDGDPNQIPTYDKTYIYMDSTARWRITDALRFMQAVGDENRAQSLLDDIIDGALRDIVNKNNLIEIIRSSDWSPEYMVARPDDKTQAGRPQFGRDKISEMILEAASKITPRYGIELIDVMFKRVNYIDTVREKVYQRMTSERKRIAAEKRSLGEGSKAEILGDVDKKLKEITSTAKRTATETMGKADAEASRIYAEAYSKHPEFYSFLKSMESYRDILGDNTSLILSSNSELFQYLQSEKRH